MRLTDNKKGRIFNKVRNRIYWKEMNICNSNYNIWDKQEIYTYQLITSNYLIHNIYNEINR
jgi:hypothetical protein